MSAPAPDAPRSALLLVNPNARNGTVPWTPCAMPCAQGGIDLFEPPGDGDCTAVIQRHAEGCDLVILGGGDGTMNAAAPALVETGLPLGILPLGTANDLARSLDLPSIPSRPPGSSPPRRRVPPISAGSTGITTSTWPASASRRSSPGSDRRIEEAWGTLGYAIAAIRVLRRVRPFR